MSDQQTLPPHPAFHAQYLESSISNATSDPHGYTGTTVKPSHSQTLRQHMSQIQNHLMYQHMQLMQTFWQTQLSELENGIYDFKQQYLPLARIKKVMKTEDVKKQMISAEVPVIFAKACEIMILELTMRAWMHAEESKRRTLQRSDVATAITKTDMFDFLIDIVPRDDAIRSTNKSHENKSILGDFRGMGMMAEQQVTAPATAYQYAYNMPQPSQYANSLVGTDQRELVEPVFAYHQQQQQQQMQYLRAQMQMQSQFLQGGNPSGQPPPSAVGVPIVPRHGDYTYQQYYQQMQHPRQSGSGGGNNSQGGATRTNINE